MLRSCGENYAAILYYDGLVSVSVLYETVREVAFLLLHALNTFFFRFLLPHPSLSA